MKMKEQKTTFWKISCLATLIFLGSGATVLAQVVTSYNDLAFDGSQLTTNITTITSPNGGNTLTSSGPLVDFADGSATPVTLSVTGGEFTGAVQAGHGADPTAGDAFTIFDGNVSGQGVLSYAVPEDSSDLVLTFTGMSPNKVYDLTFFADRGANAWDRASLVTLSGQDAFMNISSIASDNPDTTNFPGGVIFTGPTSDTTRMPSDNPNGYVSRFSNVKSGSDGMIVLTISYDGSGGSHLNKGKYAGAIRLIESGNVTNDLDGDGKADIVWRNTDTGETAVWLGNGLSTPTSGVIAGAPDAWVINGKADVDADGKADIVWRNTTTGDVAVWLGNGLGTPTTGVIAAAVPAVWVIKGIGDVDGDGKADLVWRNTSTGDVAVWLLNGLSAPTTGVISAGLPAVWVINGIGDMDMDGKADIVWRNTSTGDVAVWLGNGLSTPTTGVITAAVPAVWVIKGVGDTDGDGKADIVWRNTTTGAVVVWLGNGLTAPTTGVISAAVPAVWVISDVGDTDEDGKADLVWRNTSTGDVAVWLLNGLSAPTTGVITGSVPSKWVIQP